MAPVGPLEAPVDPWMPWIGPGAPGPIDLYLDPTKSLFSNVFHQFVPQLLLGILLIFCILCAK